MENLDTTPLISKTSFSCPHCNAYTSQNWYSLAIDSLNENGRTPKIPTLENIENVKNAQDISSKHKKHLISYVNRMMEEKPFIETSDTSIYDPNRLRNSNVSVCYNCQEISIWVHDKIVYPKHRIDIKPNNDLPNNISLLFEEARAIVDSSPKGAAALLRLCVQYLCKELGESGKNIDKDIASLVQKGLNPVVQQALDIVRVIGNESVHPGEIDLNDNKEVAVKLFSLVNLITEQMISHPKQVKALYEDLPKNKLAGIEQRDKK